MEQSCWGTIQAGAGRTDKKSTTLSELDLMGECNALKQLRGKEGKRLLLVQERSSGRDAAMQEAIGGIREPGGKSGLSRLHYIISPIAW